MLARIIVILIFTSFLLIHVVHGEQSNDSSSSTFEKKAVYVEPDAYALREQEQLKKELDSYLNAKPRGYEKQLTQSLELIADKKYDEADALLQSTRNQYPDQPDLLAHHAETLAMMNNGSFAGKPFDLLSRSLDLDVRHKPSLWMMALVNQQAGNHEAAVILFKLLKREMPPGSSSVEIIDTTMAASVDKIEALPEPEPAVAKTPKADAEGAVLPVSGNPAIRLYITLEPEILNTFLPDDVVYVFAQAPDESAMPLAVTRRKVSDFPALVILDDSMAMMPAQSLSSSTLVTVGARASRSGTAMPLAGDWEVKLYEVPVDTAEIIPLNIQYELK